MDPKTITLHRGKHEHATPRLSVGTCWVLCTGGVPFAAITDQQRTALTTGEQVVTYHETPAPVEDHPFPEFAVEAAEGCEDWILPTQRSDGSYSLVCGTASYPSRTTFRAAVWSQDADTDPDANLDAENLNRWRSVMERICAERARREVRS